MTDLDKYRGIQYAEDGKSFDGCDCFGLVELFFKEEFNINLPHYTDYEKIAETTAGVPIGEVQANDILTFKHNGQLHTGVAINKYQFMHCLSGNGVIISKIFSWQRRCTGAFRYREQINDH